MSDLIQPDSISAFARDAAYDSGKEEGRDAFGAQRRVRNPHAVDSPLYGEFASGAEMGMHDAAMEVNRQLREERADREWFLSRRRGVYGH